MRLPSTSNSRFLLTIGLLLYMIGPCQTPTFSDPITGPVSTAPATDAVIAYRFESNYQGTPPHAVLRLIFNETETLNYAAIKRNRSEPIQYVPVKAGTYRWREINLGVAYRHLLPMDYTFSIPPGKCVYIGDIDFQVKVGGFSKAHVKKFTVENNFSSVVAQLAADKPEYEPLDATIPLIMETADAEIGKAQAIPSSQDFTLLESEGTGAAIISLTWPRVNNPLGKLVQIAQQGDLVSLGIIYRREGGGPQRISARAPVWFGSKADALPLDKEKKGEVLVVALEPGKYEIFDFHAIFSGLSVSYHPRPFSLPFEIKRGTVTYLGEIHVDAKKSPIFPDVLPIKSNNYLSDQWARDYAIASQSHPGLKDFQVERSPLEALAGLSNIFSQK